MTTLFIVVGLTLYSGCLSVASYRALYNKDEPNIWIRLLMASALGSLAVLLGGLAVGFIFGGSKA